MKIKTDTHSHTIASGHAYSTIREMAKAGAEAGLEMLAITEHAPMMPETCGRFYFSNLGIIPRKMYGMQMMFGVELNILDEEGTIDLPENLLKQCTKTDCRFLQSVFVLYYVEESDEK